jgi:hypothetical protein
MLRSLLFLACTVAIVPASAQPSKLAGDYTGMFGPYHIKLHLVSDPSGKLTGTADNQDQGITGMICDNIRADGQAMSFTVPMVKGTWTGIVGQDGNTLSGLWTQAGIQNPMPLNFTRRDSAAQTGAVPAVVPVASPGDYLFNPLSGGAIVQVFRQGKSVGNIINSNGQMRVMAVPGNDAGQIQAAYQSYLALSAGAGVVPPAVTAPRSAMPGPVAGVAPGSLGLSNGGKADPSGVKFEGDTVTVPRTDGMTVIIAGDDVTIARGTAPEYVLRRKKASVGRAFEQALSKRNAEGGGVAGGGIEFLRAGGGLIFDSGMGGYNLQETPGVREAKQLALIAVDAIDTVRNIPGHSDFKPSGYNGLKDVSKYRLRSDGSR